jgi:hypothetical protein
MGSRLAPAFCLPLLALAGCAATQTGAAVAPAAPGFWLGLWHGVIFPIAWIVSLFVQDVSIYAVPNNGGWYDFGYFLGIVVFGVGARKTVTVERERRSVRQPAGGPTIEGVGVEVPPRGEGERA